MIEQAALRLRVYMGESDRHDGRPAHRALLELLRARGIWGATVTRGIAGFGKASRLHTASPLRLSADLPMIVEAVDREAKIRGVLADVTAIVSDGLVTLELVSVVTRVGDEGR